MSHHFLNYQKAFLLMISLLPTIFIFSRAFADIVIIILGLVFIYRSYKNKDWAWLSTSWVRCSLIITLYISFIVPIGANEKIPAFLNGLAFYRWPLFMAAMCFWILQGKKNLQALEVGVVAIVVFIILDSFLQYFSGFDIFGHTPIGLRLTGPFNKQVPGTFTLRFIFIAICFLYFCKYIHKERNRLILTLIGLFTSLLFVFLTGERVAFLSLFLGSAIIILSLIWLDKNNTRFLITTIGILLIFSAGFINTQEKMINRTLVSTYNVITSFESSPYGKVIIPAINIWKDNNIFTGIGVKNYHAICIQNKYDILGTESERNCNHPHNIYLQWLVETGVIGLCLFILFISLIIRSCFINTWNTKNHIVGIFAFCTILTTFWPIMTSMSFFSNLIAPLIWLSLSWSIAKTRIENLE